MRSYGYRVTEHDPDQPWIIVGSGQHVIELDDDVRFFEWARKRWPSERYSVELDPWSLTQK